MSINTALSGVALGRDANKAKDTQNDNEPDPQQLTGRFLSPLAPSFAANLSPDQLYLPRQPKSLAGIALRAFCLGAASSAALLATAAILLFTASPLWRLPFFLACLSTFHFLEFWTTAAYNTRRAEVSSFLLSANWPWYAIAHAAAAAECLFVGLIWPTRSWASIPWVWPSVATVWLGLLLVIVGQTVRSAAMCQAGESFHHLVQSTRSLGHVLVTTGMYGAMRHPSYFGFFWWAVGTQVVMGNAVCLVAYALTLWSFFSKRVKSEEQHLVTFFGENYVQYRKRVGTKMPFIP